MRHVIFPVLHGVQLDSIPDDFAASFIEGVGSYLSPEEKKHVVFLQYNWSKVTLERQMEIYNCVEKGLLRQNLRKIKHTMASDVVWYNRTKSDQGFFNYVHNELDRIIGEQIQKHRNARVALFGHSLGSQIAFNYCWETKHGDVAGIFFAGSPFTMYSGMFPGWGRLPQNLTHFLINFYNKYDFISSRIQGVHPAREVADFVRDYEVPVSYNPFDWFTFGSHGVYWNSKFVWKVVAENLKMLITEK